MKKVIPILLVAFAALVIAVALFSNAGAKYRINLDTPAAAQLPAKPPMPDSQPSATPKPAHYCGAKTKSGEPCRRRVKNEGDRCFMHLGQPSV